MAIDAVALMRELRQLRELAAKQRADAPLPAGGEADRRLRQEIDALGLHAEVAALETRGYAVLPPGRAAPTALVDHLRQALLRVADEEPPAALGGSGLGRTLFHLLPRDRVFEQALMAPAPLALVTYLLGYRAKLSQSTGLIKSAGEPALAFHADHSAKFPTPWPHAPFYANVTWTLTDYTRENGAVCVFPGSHRRGQPPPESLRMAHDHPDVEVLEVPAGSVIVWHGSLWHGALPRTAEGQRVTLVMPFCRYAVQPQELYWATTTPDMLERNPARFATLMGLDAVWPWAHDGPDPALLATGPQSGSPFE